MCTGVTTYLPFVFNIMPQSNETNGRNVAIAVQYLLAFGINTLSAYLYYETNGRNVATPVHLLACFQY